MNIGIVGMGRMGRNMAQRMQQAGHGIVAYDRDPDTLSAVSDSGITIAESLEQLVEALEPPRVVWVMVPSGNPTEATISALETVLEPGDVLVDGGNSNYKDSMRRGGILRGKGINMVDAGVSGGVWGLTEGYCLMVGGDDAVVASLEPIFLSLAPADGTGYAHVGPLGAGHYVKMIHNGIEYGLMQAYAEGFELLKAKDMFSLDLGQVADVWTHGSVIRSWLLDLTAAALKEDGGLEAIQPYVEDSGEGRWTVEESVELAVPIPVISMALQARFRSRQTDGFGFRLLAAMRQRFGGHSVHTA